MKRLPLRILAALALSACAFGSGQPQSEEAPAAEYAGALHVEPDPVRFDDTFTGCVRSAILELENRNPTAALQVAGVASPEPGFSVSGSFPLTLPPGESAFVDVHFAPADPGSRSATLEIATDEGKGARYPLAVRATGVEAPPKPRDLTALAPLDLVFVLDVSTSMQEMAKLRRAIADLFDFIEANRMDVRFGLTTYVNDVVVHRDGAFLDREGFFREFESQLVQGVWVPDPELPRQLLNFDLPENGLGALYRSASEFEFRPGSRRYFLLMTDGTFLEPYAVFSDGTPAEHSYAEVAAVLQEKGIHLFSVNARDRGQGLSANYEGRPSLVSRTAGRWFELADVTSGALTLDTLLADLVTGPACDQAPPSRG